jgi:hypothetical protein
MSRGVLTDGSTIDALTRSARLRGHPSDMTLVPGAGYTAASDAPAQPSQNLTKTPERPRYADESRETCRFQRVPERG